MAQSRIHVLGMGSIGLFAAHALGQIARRPPTTLLLHRRSLLQEYAGNGNRISLEASDGATLHSDGYNLEVLDHGKWFRSTGTERGPESTDQIENLIVSVKAPNTVKALQPLGHRLQRSSNILFLQNGSGMIEAVNENLFTDPETRPNYIVGIISHGVVTKSPFSIIHTGPASTSFGLVPRDHEEALNPAAYDLIRALCAAPIFNGQLDSFVDVFQKQLEKLTVNSFLNPLCALHDTSNIFGRTMPEYRRQLVEEISNVALSLPELRNVPGVKQRFSADALDEYTIDIMEKNIKTVGSMVWDLRGKKQTEVRFLNGYWSRRGKELGIETPLNDSMVRQIEERTKSFAN